MAEFISLAALKLALDVTDTASDILLTGLNKDATDLMIEWMGRDPRANDYEERTDGLGSQTVVLNQYPINSVAAVTVLPRGWDLGQTLPQPLDGDAYDFDKNVVWRRGGVFPRGRRNILVSYNAGEDPAPRNLSLAATYTVRALLTARKVDLNATGESWAGVNAVGWSPEGPGVLPQSAKTLLKSFVTQMVV